MNKTPVQGHSLSLGGAELTALPEGALWWPAEGLLAVSDLHLGKSERMARRSGALVPPYESAETLVRLDTLVERLRPARVLCLGDSFDDLEAARALPDATRLALARLMAGRRWTWVLGNHDPGPPEMGGACVAEVALGGIVFRHIAQPGERGAEVSGHFHPKLRIGGARRPCFVTDRKKLILPAFGTYTGGLDAQHPDIAGLFEVGARAVLTGTTMACVPLRAVAGGRPGPRGGWRRGGRHDRG